MNPNRRRGEEPPLRKASELHPIQYGKESEFKIDEAHTYSEDRAETVREGVQKIRINNYDRFETERGRAEMEEGLESTREKIEYKREGRKSKDAEGLAKLREIEKSTLPTFVPTRGEVAEQFSGMNDPWSIQMISSLPPEKQGVFSKYLGMIEMQKKNPEMLALMQLIDTLRNANQPKQQQDPIQLMRDMLGLQNEFKKSIQGEISSVQLTSSAKDDEWTALIKDGFKYYLKKQLDTVLPSSEQNSSLVSSTGSDSSMELWLDESTGMYLPKKINAAEFDKYLKIDSIRRQRLSELEEATRAEKREQMIEKQVINPLMEIAKPLIEKLGENMADRAMAPTGPEQPQVMKRTAEQPPPSSRPFIEIPSPGVATKEVVKSSAKEKLSCLCGNELIIQQDARGVWQDKVHCPKCDRNFTLDQTDSEPPK